MASNYKDDATDEADKTFISISKHALGIFPSLFLSELLRLRRETFFCN